MENKELIKLYKKVLIIFKERNTQWICNAINMLKTTPQNKVILKEHFFTQLPSPTQYAEIYNEPTFNKRVRGGDYTDIWFIHIGDFECWETNYKVRIKLIEAIINNLENNGTFI